MTIRLQSAFRIKHTVPGPRFRVVQAYLVPIEIISLHNPPLSNRARGMDAHDLVEVMARVNGHYPIAKFLRLPNFPPKIGKMRTIKECFVRDIQIAQCGAESLSLHKRETG